MDFNNHLDNFRLWKPGNNSEINTLNEITEFPVTLDLSDIARSPIPSQVSESWI